MSKRRARSSAAPLPARPERPSGKSSSVERALHRRSGGERSRAYFAGLLGLSPLIDYEVRAVYLQDREFEVVVKSRDGKLLRIAIVPNEDLETAYVRSRHLAANPKGGLEAFPDRIQRALKESVPSNLARLTFSRLACALAKDPGTRDDAPRSEAVAGPDDPYARMSQNFPTKRTLFRARSPYQEVAILETSMGRMLFNDGLVMVSEEDEAIYHEMMAHVPLFCHPRPRRVLVIGGGDGGTAREALRHPSVERCVLVEIDAMVLEACRRHLRQTAAALDDPRVEVLVEDGARFVARTRERFDAVLVDSTGPFIGPASPLFRRRFYADVRRILSPGGVVVSQAESPFFEPEAQRGLARTLRSVFRTVRLYNFSNLTYPGGLWSFSFASDRLDPLADLRPARIRASGLRFHYYSPGIHRAAFELPQFQQDNLGLR